jgi:uncharacterized protein (TIGR02996 family)
VATKFTLTEKDQGGPREAMRAAFVRAVCEEPEEDVHRLALADWLEDNGGAGRAEFIRGMIRAWRHPRFEVCYHLPVVCQVPAAVEASGWPSAGGPFGGELLARWRQDHASLYPRFRVEQLGDVQGDAAEFRRGFVESITLTLDAFLEHAVALFSAHPITEVTLSDRGLAEDPYGQRFAWFATSPGQEMAPSWARAALPPGLFGRLRGGIVHPNAQGYGSEQAAWAALSAACVAYGRDLVRLPELPP